MVPWRQHNSMILHRIISVMPSIASLKLFKYDKSLKLIKHILRWGDFLSEINTFLALFSKECGVQEMYWVLWDVKGHSKPEKIISLLKCVWQALANHCKNKSCCIYLRLCIGWTNRKNVRYFGNHWQKNKCQFYTFMNPLGK